MRKTLKLLLLLLLPILILGQSKPISKSKPLVDSNTRRKRVDELIPHSASRSARSIEAIKGDV
jgi:hypothetical protein